MEISIIQIKTRPPGTHIKTNEDLPFLFFSLNPIQTSIHLHSLNAWFEVCKLFIRAERLYNGKCKEYWNLRDIGKLWYTIILSFFKNEKSYYFTSQLKLFKASTWPCVIWPLPLPLTWIPVTLPLAHFDPITPVLQFLKHTRLISTKGLAWSTGVLLHIPWIALKFHISGKLFIAQRFTVWHFSHHDLPFFQLYLCLHIHHSKSYVSYSFDDFLL